MHGLWHTGSRLGPRDNRTMTIQLLIGLGNPGAEYEGTRHNAGFWWVDEVARKLGASLSHDRTYHGLVTRVNRPGGQGPLWLLQPQTYMNLSGKSVAALARFFKLPPESMLVAHDELDLPTGQMRLKQGGGAAGHNGLRDMQAQLGNPNFWRLRLGIGHPGVKAEVADYVLRKPTSADRHAIDDCIARSLASLDLLLAGDMAKAMMQLHKKPPPPPGS
jgi:peptidyl-tRNA hydrolase, PTH1 family